MRQVLVEAAILRAEGFTFIGVLEGIVSNAIGGVLSGLILALGSFLLAKRGWPRQVQNGVGKLEPPKVIREPVVVVQDAKKASPELTSGQMWLFGAIGLIVAVFFVWHFRSVFWVAVGVLSGLFVMLGFTIWRAKQYGAWWPRDLRLVFETLATGAACAVAWVNVFTKEYRGVSIPVLADRVNELFEAQDSEESWLGRVLGTVVDFIGQYLPDGVLLFTILQASAVLFSILLIIWSWLSLIDWHCYIGYLLGSEKSWVQKRMLVYAQQGWGTILAFVVFALMIIVFSSGIFLNFANQDLTTILQ